MKTWGIHECFGRITSSLHILKVSYKSIFDTIGVLLQIRKKVRGLTLEFRPCIQPKTSLLKKFSTQLINQFFMFLKNETFLHFFPSVLHSNLF